MIKTYQLINYISADVYVIVDGKEVYLSFKGTLDNKGRIYVKDKKLQEAIEKDSNYGKLYTLVEEIEEQKPTESSNSEAQPQSTEQAIELKEVTAKNLQGINDLVKELFPEYGKSFKSSEKAVEYFKERGYSLMIE